jgi:hypothetical protein
MDHLNMYPLHVEHSFNNGTNIEFTAPYQFFMSDISAEGPELNLVISGGASVVLDTRSAYNHITVADGSSLICDPQFKNTCNDLACKGSIEQYADRPQTPIPVLTCSKITEWPLFLTAPGLISVNHANLHGTLEGVEIAPQGNVHLTGSYTNYFWSDVLSYIRTVGWVRSQGVNVTLDDNVELVINCKGTFESITTGVGCALRIDNYASATTVLLGVGSTITTHTKGAMYTPVFKCNLVVCGECATLEPGLVIYTVLQCGGMEFDTSQPITKVTLSDGCFVWSDVIDGEFKYPTVDIVLREAAMLVFNKPLSPNTVVLNNIDVDLHCGIVVGKDTGHPSCAPIHISCNHLCLAWSLTVHAGHTFTSNSIERVGLSVDVSGRGVVDVLGNKVMHESLWPTSVFWHKEGTIGFADVNRVTDWCDRTVYIYTHVELDPMGEDVTVYNCVIFRGASLNVVSGSLHVKNKIFMHGDLYSSNGCDVIVGEIVKNTCGVFESDGEGEYGNGTLTQLIDKPGPQTAESDIHTVTRADAQLLNCDNLDLADEAVGDLYVTTSEEEETEIADGAINDLYATASEEEEVEGSEEETEIADGAINDLYATASEEEEVEGSEEETEIADGAINDLYATASEEEEAEEAEEVTEIVAVVPHDETPYYSKFSAKSLLKSSTFDIGGIPSSRFIFNFDHAEYAPSCVFNVKIPTVLDTEDDVYLDAVQLHGVPLTVRSGRLLVRNRITGCGLEAHLICGEGAAVICGGIVLSGDCTSTGGSIHANGIRAASIVTRGGPITAVGGSLMLTELQAELDVQGKDKDVVVEEEEVEQEEVEEEVVDEEEVEPTLMIYMQDKKIIELDPIEYGKGVHWSIHADVSLHLGQDMDIHVDTIVVEEGATLNVCSGTIRVKNFVKANGVLRVRGAAKLFAASFAGDYAVIGADSTLSVSSCQCTGVCVTDTVSPPLQLSSSPLQRKPMQLNPNASTFVPAKEEEGETKQSLEEDVVVHLRECVEDSKDMHAEMCLTWSEALVRRNQQHVAYRELLRAYQDQLACGDVSRDVAQITYDALVASREVLQILDEKTELLQIMRGEAQDEVFMDEAMIEAAQSDLTDENDDAVPLQLAAQSDLTDENDDAVPLQLA